MSGAWWRSTEPERRTGLIARLQRPFEVESGPATLLRQPLMHEPGPATHVAERGDKQARRRDCRLSKADYGTAKDQAGFVKLWRAKSVDLRRLYLTPYPGSDQGGAAGGEPGHSEGHLPGVRKELDPLLQRLALILQPPPESLLRMIGPLNWPGELFPYQRDGVHALILSHGLLLGDDMGLGKTIQVIAALRILLFRKEIADALIVVPASLLDQWQRELALWAPELRVMVIGGAPADRAWQWQFRAHVTIASYETVRADALEGQGRGPLRRTWSVVALDEAQKIKNRDASISRVCKRLPRQRSWAITGTPLENQIDDVASLLEFVGGSSVHTGPLTGGAAIRARLSETQLRRRKEDVLRDLPPKLLTDVILPLTTAQQQAYDRAEQEGVLALRDGTASSIEHVLALIMRLKQICNFAPQDGSSAKLADLETRLEELVAEGHRALVFTQFVGDETGARRIAAGLTRFAPLLYTGGMSRSQRDAQIKAFQEDLSHKVLILSLKAGGLGLNLQTASYVFHFDRWWNPAVERQAEDRAHRLGQLYPVHIYRYIMAETIEERIDALLKVKTELFKQVIDDPALTIDRLLTQEDLFGLFGLRIRNE